MTTPSKTLTPFTAAELQLCFDILNHSLSHPCHKCLELEALTDKVNYFRLKAKGLAESNPTKVFANGIKKKSTPKFEVETSDIPMPSKKLIDKMQHGTGTNFQTSGTTDRGLIDKLHEIAPETTKLIEGMSKVGKRTQNKLNSKKPPFGFS
jgi:hypothetical protein